MLENKRKFAIVLIIGLIYAGLSFAYSFLGFLHPESGIPLGQISASATIAEVSGHFLFGFLAALPLMDLDLAILTGIMAFAMDTDHFIGALGFNINGRPAHSFFDIVVATLVLVALAKKFGMTKEETIKISFVGAITLFSHLSYDLLASGTGTQFPLFIPFDFNQVVIDSSFWVFFEALAFFTAFLGYYIARRKTKGQPLRPRVPVETQAKMDSASKSP